MALIKKEQLVLTNSMEQTKIYIYGGGGHGMVISEIAQLKGYDVIFIDDLKGCNFDGHFKTNNLRYPCVKFSPDLPKFNVLLGIGDNNARREVYNRLMANGFIVSSIAHPSAIISKYAKIEDAVVIMANVVVNCDSHIGCGSVLNTSCIVEHDCKIGSFSHIAPNVALAGGVKIENGCLIGVGSCIKPNIKIGENTIIGAGSVVVSDILSNKIAIGNPAKVIKENI